MIQATTFLSLKECYLATIYGEKAGAPHLSSR